MSNPESFAHTHSAGHVIGGGRYSLHVTLGDSNQVWLAQDEVEQRLAVIRFFPGELRRDRRAWDAVKSRVTALLSVNHPALSGVLEWYEAEGVEPFVAFEYMEGEALAARNASLPWAKLAPVARDVAAALHALHSRGVVHRGVEPGNIIITESGAKLVNAVVTGILKDPLLSPLALQKPAELRWCSPQQLAGEPPSGADDFYGFGATMFELLTGTPLFANTRTLLTDLRNGPPADVAARLAAVPGVPSEVAEFLISCLVRDAGQRPTSVPFCLQPETPGASHSTEPSTAAEESEPAENTVVARLEPVPDTAIIRTTTHPVRRRSKMPALVAVGVVLCATACGAAWFVRQSQAEKQRVAAAQEEQTREAERLNRQAEEQRLQAAILEEKRQKEEQARQIAAAELKQRESEAARTAAAENERREIHASVQPVADKAPAPADSKPLPLSVRDDGFVTIFNGDDLSGWEGPTNVWSVIDGCITAQLPPEAPRQKRSYLVWKNGKVEDFELRFSYRFRVLRGNKQPNGGLVYRATTNNTPELSAYQFDVVPDVKNVGAVNEDKKRYRLAGYGESAVASVNEKTQVIEQVGDTNKLSSVRPEDWNTGVIVARGNHLTHYINGEVSADLVDENVKRIHKSGMLALEVYARNTNNSATFLQFRDIKFKRLEKSSTMLSASR
jgi:hypothetical protein